MKDDENNENDQKIDEIEKRLSYIDNMNKIEDVTKYDIEKSLET